MQHLQFIKGIIPALIFCFLLGCGSDKPKGIEEALKEARETDKDKPEMLKVGNQLFSIPSPIQTAILIKESGSEFNLDKLVPAGNVSNYSTNFEKALMLGIYGADLGYVSLYNQEQEALKLLNAVQQLAGDLGILGAFDEDLVTRFSENIGIPDSLLVLVSDFYKAGDTYLKNNERSDMSGLVLAGGWVEALYFSASEGTSNPEIRKRIGEQKSSLGNLIKLLMQNGGKANYQDFVGQLNELNELFEAIDITYEFQKPEIIPEKKLAIIKSNTVITMTDDQLKNIIHKINSIRNSIVK